MDEYAGSDENRALRAQLELYLDRRPITGRLCPERGAEERFVGWLGFADALKRLQERQDRDRGGRWR
jgi:hypothetical protein